MEKEKRLFFTKNGKEGSSTDAFAYFVGLKLYISFLVLKLCRRDSITMDYSTF